MISTQQQDNSGKILTSVQNPQEQRVITMEEKRKLERRLKELSLAKKMNEKNQQVSLEKMKGFGNTYKYNAVRTPYQKVLYRRYLTDFKTG